MFTDEGHEERAVAGETGAVLAAIVGLTRTLGIRSVAMSLTYGFDPQGKVQEAEMALYKVAEQGEVEDFECKHGPKLPRCSPAGQ